MTEKELQAKLFKWRIDAGHNWICPNSHPFRYEVDLFSITNKGYGIDHEIKCSLADFRAELKSVVPKNRHKYIRKYWKHRNYAEAFEHGDNRIVPCPNYFIFVSELGIIPANEVPSYAGLIWYLPPCDSFETIIRAPRLHSRPVTQKVKDTVTRSLMFRTWRVTEDERHESASSGN